MLVTCIHARISECQLSQDLQAYLVGMYQEGFDGTLPLSVGHSYVVYALALGPFGYWVYIDSGDGSLYPQQFPLCLFEVRIPRFSKYWQLGHAKDYRGSRFVILTFAEWAEGRAFHGDMFEGDADSLRIFANYKQRMDVEHPRPEIHKTVEAVGSPPTVLDHDSGKFWEVDPCDALVTVPSTGELKNNPYYQSKLP